jgi:RNA polymerase sigma factor (sigma-70 family)
MLVAVEAIPRAENSLATPPGSGVAQQPFFPTTHWSLVLMAGQQKAPQAEAALEQLCRIYWRPLYVYVRRRSYSEPDAEDLTQEFFAWLLKRNWLGAADPQRGRFRFFLQTTLNRFLANEWDKSQRLKRGGGRIVPMPCHEEEACLVWEPADHRTPEQSYEWRWALTVLDQVLGRLGTEYATRDKAGLFAELKPTLLGESSAQPYAALALKLGMTEGSVKVVVYRLRQRYRQLLRDEIANTVAQPDQIDDEMLHLFNVLGGGR